MPYEEDEEEEEEEEEKQQQQQQQQRGCRRAHCCPILRWASISEMTFFTSSPNSQQKSHIHDF